MTLKRKTLYIYKQEKNTKLYKIKKTEQNKEAKMKNGCASKVLAVGSSIGLSSLP